MLGSSQNLSLLLRKMPPVVSLGVAHISGYHSGVILGERGLPTIGWAALGMVALGPAAALRLSGRIRPLCVTLLVFCFFLVGVARGVYTESGTRELIRKISDFCGESVTVIGVVAGFPSTLPDGVRFPLELSALTGDGRSTQWERRRPRVLATVKPSAQVHYGDLLCLTGRLAAPTGPRNPGGFGFGAYLAGRRLHGSFKAKCSRVRLLDDGYGTPLRSRAMAPVRRGIGNMVDRHLEGDSRSLLRGLLLGDRSLLDPGLRRAMAEAGVAHIMAVSGLHVGLVAVILGCGAKSVRFSARSADVFCLVGVWLYCGMVGLPASACRAASIVTAYVICRGTGKQAVSYCALAAAGFILAIAYPPWTKTPGFQLSFSAAGGVLAFKDTLIRYIERSGHEYGPGVRGAMTLMGASIGAQIASWPLVALHFGQTPLLFLVGNAVAVPLVGVVLTWGLTAVILNLVSATLAGWALASCWAAASLLSLFCKFVGAIPWASAAVPAFSPVLVAVYLVALAAAVSTRGGIRILAVGLLTLASVLICLGIPRPSQGDELEVAFLDVGHGDACVYIAPSGETMLVDAGACRPGWDAGENVILPYLRTRGVRSVNRAVISHGDGDHWEGLASLAGSLHIEELVLPAAVPLGSLTGLVSNLERKGTVVRWVQAGDTLPPLGGLECVALHPSGRFEESRGTGLGDSLNERSLVLRVRYGDVVFLMTGDIEAVAEEWLIAEVGKSCGGLLDCTVLKVPHHGSDTSSSAGFVSLASPLLAVISCGPRELFNLPKTQVLERYKSLGALTKQTAHEGAVILRTDGRKVTVTPFLRPAESSEFLALGPRAPVTAEGGPPTAD